MENVRCMGQTTVMTSQLLLHRDNGKSRLEVVPYKEAAEPSERSNPLRLDNPAEATLVARLGSQDLLYIAEFASENGFLVDGFQIVGRHGSRVDEYREVKISEFLKEGLLKSGARFASTKFARDYPGYSVGAIKLTDPEMYQLTIKRFGIVEADDAPSIEPFLRSAWERIHFS